MEMSPSHRVVSLPGKGEGLIATRDIAAGTLIVDEAPIVVLDPPTKRKDLLMLLGCRLFSTIDMRTTPDNIRSEREVQLHMTEPHNKFISSVARFAICSELSHETWERHFFAELCM